MRPTAASLFFTLVFLPTFTTATAAEPKVAVNVSTDRAEAIYKTGEEVRFQIEVVQQAEVVDSGTVNYTLTEDGLNPLGSGSVPLGNEPAVVVGRMARPGFLQLRATYQPPEGKPVSGLGGAAISPLEIEPSLPAPDDFDEFWNDQKAQLARIPLDPQLEPVASPAEGIVCFDVKVECLGGAPVSGYFARPKDSPAKSLPAILWVHGAGVGSSSLASAVKGAQAGMLSMDINAHGIPNGRPADYYAELTRGELSNYRHAGRESRDTIYFRGMFLRLVRAIDFLTSQPEWNGKVMAVVGHSQGGGQALAAGGLDPRVTCIGAGVPAICDHSGRAAGRINGWPKLVPTADDGQPDPAVLQAARYVDAVNFASRCKADAVMSVGFIDSTCPPTTCYAAYNQLQGKKQIINEPKMGHAAPAPIHEAFMNFVLDHVQKRTSPASE
jgi:cephalosporin-C deacetylase-like acetyl esterase